MREKVKLQYNILIFVPPNLSSTKLTLCSPSTTASLRKNWISSSIMTSNTEWGERARKRKNER